MKASLFSASCLLASARLLAAPTPAEIHIYNNPAFSNWGLFFETGNQLVLHDVKAGGGGKSLISGLYTSVDFEEADPYHLPDDWYVSSRLYSLAPDGTLNWSREYHSSVHSFLGIKDALPTTTGNLAIGSFRQPDLHYDLWAALTDPSGHIVTEYTWDFALPEPVPPQEWMNVIHGTHVLPTSTPGEYLVCGYYSVSANPNSGFLFVFDAATGTEIWRQGIIETGATWAMPIIASCAPVPGGDGYILATDHGVHRIDATGNHVWSYAMGNRFFKAIPIDGGFAVLGPDNLFTFLNDEGVLLSERTLATEEKEIELIDFVRLGDGYAFCGHARWLIYEDTDVLLYRTDASGDELYSYPIGSRNDERASSLRLTGTGTNVIIEAIATCEDGEDYPWIFEIGLDHTRPVASFVVESPTTYTPFVEEPVTFDASASFDPDGTLNWYYWDWGDGTTSNSPVMDNPTHRFQKTGDLTVSLRVRDNEGVETTTSIGVTVLPWAEQWTRDLATGTQREMRYLVKTDEGYAVAGWHGSSTRIVKFVRLDERGLLIPGSTRSFINPVQSWQNTFPHDMQATPDGGFVLACVNETNTGTRDYSLRLLKLDANGDKEWDRIFGTDQNEYGTQVHPLPDGSGFVITGWQTVSVDGAAKTHPWFLRTNADASVVVAERNDYAIPSDYTYGIKTRTMIACADGSGYIVDLDSSSVRTPYEFMKVDLMGEELWRAAFDYEANSYNLIIRLAEGAAGEIYVAGESKLSSFVGQFTESEGTVANDWVLSPVTGGWWWAGVDWILPRAGGGLFALHRGEVESFVHRPELVRINPAGELLWSHVYDENGFASESPSYPSLLLDDNRIVMVTDYRDGSKRARRLFMLAPNHRPHAFFDLPAEPIQVGVPFRLDATATTDADNEGRSLTYLWYIPGSGFTTTMDPVSPPFTIGFAGSQTLTLTVIDADGGEDILQRVVEVQPAPAGHVVQFHAADAGSLTGETWQVVADGADCTPVEAVPAGETYFAFWEGNLFTSENPLAIENVRRHLSATAHFLDIPDAWFSTHGLTPDTSTVTGDSDGDGALDWEEFLADTDPTDPDDRFTIEELAHPDGLLEVTCESHLGCTYTLLYASDIDTHHWTVHSTQAGTGDTLVFDCSALAGERWFFRILVTRL